MKRSNKFSEAGKEPDVSEYYRLNTRAIDDLVNADAENSPPVSEEELRRVGSRSKRLIPEPVAVTFIRFWFPAAVCFFFLWGLGAYIGSTLDLLFITAIAMGAVTDLLTNNVLRFTARRPGGRDRWMMYPAKKFYTLPLNILHAMAVMALVFTFYTAANRLLIYTAGAEPDSVPLGVEPLLFGLVYMGFDTLLICAKRLMKRIIADAVAKTK